MRFVFDDYELDATRFELRHKGVPTALEPQVFDLLNYLVKNNTRIISKQELMDKLWAGKIVSESTLTSCIKAARKAIGDDGQSQRYISTLHRRGYRFVGPLQTEAPPVAQKPGETGDLITQGALASSEEIGEACLFPIPPAPKEKRITIVVLPISTQENETVQFFAQALFDDMNIQLARTPGFLVVSRNSANYFRQSGSDAKQIALDTGAHYLVDGTIQSSGDTVHLSLKLLETEQGTVIWGLRKNIPIQQLNELQQEIILNIVSAIEPEINRVEFASLRKRREVDLGAWELYRKGHAILGLKGWSEESFGECAELMREAIQRDPELAFAYAYLSLTLALGNLVGLVTQDGWREEAVSAAEKAIALDSQDPDVLGYVGCAFCDLGNDFRGMKLLERALSIDPSNAQAWAALGAAQLRNNQEEGVEKLYHGIRISPRDNRIGAWGALLARGLLNFGRVSEAIEVAEKACAVDDKIFLPRIVLCIAHALNKATASAKAALEDGRRIRPHISIRDFTRFASEQEIQNIVELGILS